MSAEFIRVWRKHTLLLNCDQHVDCIMKERLQLRFFLGKTMNICIYLIEMHVQSSLSGFMSRWLQRESKIALLSL